MAAPVVATAALIPATPEAPVSIPANDEVVTSTPFLDWQPAAAGAGGVAQLQLSTPQMVSSFTSRCSISRLPPDMAAARNIHLLALRFTSPFWGRVLSELKASGLFARPMANRAALHNRLLALSITNPAALQIVAGDWSAAPAFAIPAGGLNAPIRVRLNEVRFITLASVVALEDFE